MHCHAPKLRVSENTTQKRPIHPLKITTTNLQRRIQATLPVVVESDVMSQYRLCRYIY